MEEVEREAPPVEPASSGVTSQPVDDDSLQDVDDEEFKDAADGNHCNYIMRPCNILKPSIDVLKRLAARFNLLPHVTKLQI